MGTVNFNERIRRREVLDTVWKVVDVRSDGTATLEVTFDRIRAKAMADRSTKTNEGGAQHSPTETLDYDSKTGKATVSKERSEGAEEAGNSTSTAVERFFARIRAASYRFEAQANGTVSPVTESASLSRQAGEGAEQNPWPGWQTGAPHQMAVFGDFVSGSYAPGDESQRCRGVLIQLGMIPFPATPVASGQSWRRTYQVNLSQGLATVDLVYTYEGPASYEGRPAERISVQGHVKTAMEGYAGEMVKYFQFSSRDGTDALDGVQNLSGEFYFDNQAGRLAAGNLTFRQLHKVSMPGMMSMERTASQSATLAEGTTAEAPLELPANEDVASSGPDKGYELLRKEYLEKVQASRYDEAARVAEKMVHQACAGSGNLEGMHILTLLFSTSKPERLSATRIRTAESLLLWGDVLVKLGRYSSAEAVYLNALQLRRMALRDRPHPEMADLMDRLADLCLCQERLAEAERFYQQALPIHQAQFSQADRSTPAARQAATRLTAALAGMAELERRRGRLDQAQKQLRQALEIQESLSGSEPAQIPVLLALADVCRDAQQDDEALSLYAKALTLSRSASAGAAEPARCLTALAEFHARRGRHAEAEKLYRQSVAHCRKTLGEEHVDTFRAVVALAEHLHQHGQSREADSLVEPLLVGEAAKNLAPETRALACDLHARIAWQRGQQDQALAALAQAISLAEQQRSETTGAGRERARWYNRFSDMFDRLIRWQAEAGHLPAAHAAAERSRARLLMDELSWRAVDLVVDSSGDDFGMSGATMLDTTQLMLLANSFLVPPDAIQGQKRPRPAAPRTADREEDDDDEDSAEEESSNEVTGEESLQALFSSATARGQQTQALRKLQILDEVARLTPQQRADRLAQIDAQFSQYQNGSQPFSQDVARMWSKLSQEREVLTEIADYSSDEIEQMRSKMRQELLDSGQTIVDTTRQQRNRNPVYWWGIAKQWKPASLEEIEKWTGQEQAMLLQYSLSAQGGMVFVLAPGMAARLEKLDVDAQQAAALGIDPGPLTIDRSRAALLGKRGLLARLSDPDRALEAIPALEALWKVLVPKPAQQALTAGKLRRLVLVPDGPLALLPFEALVVRRSPSPQYLLDQGPPIAYGHSATLLHKLAGRAAATTNLGRRPVLAVADPVYPASAQLPGDPTSLTASISQTRFARLGVSLPPLQHSQIESQWFLQVFGQKGIPGDQLLQQQATEQQVRGQVSGRRIVLFSCHGLSLENAAEPFAALALTPGATGRGPTTTSADDGFLSLEEACDLNLQGCELVILSACQTNFGPEQRGEGIWGMSRGFLAAGARRVVASNWLVDDEAAASLTSYLCGGIANGLSSRQQPDYAQCLHTAKKWIRQQEKWKSPYYWATFVLIGPN
jgi:CHAT domain-containing protein